MKTLKSLVILLLATPSLFFAAKLDAEGELRNRFAYMINKDQDSNRSADFGIIDLRGRIGLKLSSKDNPFYLKYKMEIGNLSWGESAFGTDLGTDGINVETKSLYIGYKSDKLSGKVGLMSFSTPLGAEIDNDLAGIKLAYKGDFFHAEALYSLASAGASTNLNDNPSFFELDLSDNADIYYAMGGIHNKVTDASVWFLRYTDKSWGNDLKLNYAGLYNELKLGVLKVDAGAVYNFGTVSPVTNSNVTVSSLHVYAKAELEIPRIITIFGRFNMTTGNGGNNTNWTSIGQFQTIHGRGNLNSDLSILFGGSSFNQQAYFDSNVPTANTKKNLTQGGYHNDDFGLMVIEAGVKRDFQIGKVKWTPKAVFGMGYTVSKLTNGAFGLGYEFDLHNKFELSKTTEFVITAAMLIPGRALTDVFDNTFPGVTITSLGSDATFKIDGQLEIKI